MYEKSGDTVMMCVIQGRERKTIERIYKKKKQRVDGNGIFKRIVCMETV